MRQATGFCMSPSPASPVFLTVKLALPRAVQMPLTSRLDLSQTSVAVGVMVGVLVGVLVCVAVGVGVSGRLEHEPVVLKVTDDRKLVR